MLKSHTNIVHISKKKERKYDVGTTWEQTQKKVNCKSCKTAMTYTWAEVMLWYEW